MTLFGDPQHQETTEKLDKTFTIIYFIGLDFGNSLGSPQEETARERSEGLFPDQQLIIEPNILFYFFNFKEKLHTISNKEQISDFGYVDSILRLVCIK